jgi:hypothetical protein
MVYWYMHLNDRRRAFEDMEEFQAEVIDKLNGIRRFNPKEEKEYTRTDNLYFAKVRGKKSI